jgi:hypothetical protein
LYAWWNHFVQSNLFALANINCSNKTFNLFFTCGFTVDRGVLAVNAGSSGFDDPFIEFFLRVHHMTEKTAAVRFDYPIGGTTFEIKALEK